MKPKTMDALTINIPVQYSNSASPNVNSIRSSRSQTVNSARVCILNDIFVSIIYINLPIGFLKRQTFYLISDEIINDSGKRGI